jgi:pyrimidine operon attenuation protein/uracil phosphoribosyltransferase
MSRASTYPHSENQGTEAPIPRVLSPPIKTRVILNADEIRRAIVRIAHEILERTEGASDVILVGLYHEGIPLAERLASHIQSVERRTIPIGRLDYSTFRDDIHERGPFISPGPTDIPTDVTNRTVILVDDVLHTGRTVRAALDALIKHGRPAKIQVAVLIDRGHRELPIRADYVGKNLPTRRDEWAVVHLRELQGIDQVLLLREADVSSYREECLH